MYAYHDKLEEALSCYNKLKECDPSFVLDDFKLTRLSAVLIKNNRLNEGLELLNKQQRSNDENVLTFPHSAHCWRLLNSLADQGRADDLDTVFKALLEKGYIEINNVNLGPLVKVHLVNNDIDKAIDKFEWCSVNHRSTPWKNEIACR